MTTANRQSRIAEMIERGATLDEVQQDVIDESPVDPDERAALWLYAWSFRTRGQQRYDANQLRHRHGARNEPVQPGRD